MPHHFLSHHVRRRAQQRGIRTQHLRFLLVHADRAQPCGAGCDRLSLSRTAVADLARHTAPPAFLERVQRLTAIVADDGTIVTAYRAAGHS